MSSEIEFDKTELDKIISEALDDSVIPVDRQFGQLGFMETQVVQNIFESLDGLLPISKISEIVQNARIPLISETTKIKITDLHTVTHNCRKCQISSVVPQLPKWNVQNPDVVFIVETSQLSEQTSALFVSTLKNAGFSSEKVCLTYLVRCPVPSIKVEESYISNCSSYLHQEIQIMNPKLIVTLGAKPFSALTGVQDIKLKEYKGNVMWLGSWPILPLYSLMYIIKSGSSSEESFQSEMRYAFQFCYKEVN